MSDQEQPEKGELVPAKNREVAGRPSSLVARGLVDLALNKGERLPLDGKGAEFYYNRGRAWSEKECYDKAIQDYDQAIQLNPIYELLYRARGEAFYEKREFDKAIKDYNEAIRLNPQDAYLYALRGLAWSRKRDQDRAIKDFTEAIHRGPKDPFVYYRRGLARLRKENYDGAFDDFDEAIRLDPDRNSDLYMWFAWLLAKCPLERLRDGNRAIGMATKACQLTDWKNGWQLDTLAAAYAEAGQFDEAVRYQRKALEDPHQRIHADEFRARLELYEQKKPHRQSN